MEFVPTLVNILKNQKHVVGLIYKIMDESVMYQVISISVIPTLKKVVKYFCYIRAACLPRPALRLSG